MDNGKQLLTIKQTAEYLQMSERTIYNRCRINTDLKPFPVAPKRIGRLLRWDRAELDAYIESL